MMAVITDVALIAATLTTGLAAGLLAAFGYAVMPGLRRIDDRAFVTTMRAINVAILNGWFVLAFAGALLFTLAAAVLHVLAPRGAGALWILIALGLYVMTLGITGLGNVPLNDRLAADASGDDAATRANFERSWTRWNHFRTVASVAAFGCLVVALLER